MAISRARVPPRVKKRVFSKVCELADAHGYLRQKRPANGAFIQSLLVDPHVGLVLAEHLERSRVRNYIKDALLKEYAESKRPTVVDPKEAVPKKFHGALFLEKRRDIWKFMRNGACIVATRCSFKHWELGVKKVALAASSSTNRPTMLLLVQPIDPHLNSGEKKQAEHAWRTLGVDWIWC